ncbi:MerR family transcriptional regulator [Pseudomonas sp. GX19020]|uniref:MerR family transcriptional regulator n=1 Tax=Pseudomonas sp. GX19020 TaxID=2942277 RepID=UPI002018935F|nr:MerR family transcriptional regulator [Pseudomonas sp. GX19020]MCL4065077.1 MerR family transcriptional regulator [Pseudomonas sp. GX19020]
MDKSPDAFRTISEVAEVLDTPAHVLRFWETRFPQIRPVKRAGGRRYYRPSDLALLAGIRRLLHEEGMTIRGVQKILREQGVRHVAGLTDETSAEEEALISAMSVKTTRRGAEVTRLTPREANEASIEALESEAHDAKARNDGPDSDTGDLSAGETTGTVIAFPGEPSREAPPDSDLPETSPQSTEPPVKEPALSAFDPRQSMFPGFEPPHDPDESLVMTTAEETEEEEAQLHNPDDLSARPDAQFPAGAGADADLADHEEAPFAFDIGPEDDLAAETASITAFPIPEADRVTVAETDRLAEQSADAPGAAGPEHADALTGSPSETPAFRPQTLAARLRALPPGSLSARNDSLRALSRRITALRQRLSEAQKHGG